MGKHISIGIIINYFCIKR